MFDDTHGEELSGLEVQCRGASHDQLFDIAQLGGVSLADLMANVTGGMDQIRRICASFPDRMLEWNHEEEDGTPIPCTRQSFFDEDYTFTLPIVMAWVNTIRVDAKTGDTVSSSNQTFTESDVDLTDLPMIYPPVAPE